jgi:diguanylate cyclase (GGDEF)-like protein
MSEDLDKDQAINKEIPEDQSSSQAKEQDSDKKPQISAYKDGRRIDKDKGRIQDPFEAYHIAAAIEEERKAKSRTAALEGPQIADYHTRELVPAWSIRMARDKERTRQELLKAKRDQLTGLETRVGGQPAIEQAVKEFNEGKRDRIVAGMVEIKLFSWVNDLFRLHAIGDGALRSLARILLANARRNDHVYRWGGDEFLIFLNDGIDQSPKEISKMLDGKKETIEEEVRQKTLVEAVFPMAARQASGSPEERAADARVRKAFLLQAAEGLLEFYVDIKREEEEGEEKGDIVSQRTRSPEELKAWLEEESMKGTPKQKEALRERIMAVRDRFEFNEETCPELAGFIARTMGEEDRETGKEIREVREETAVKIYESVIDILEEVAVNTAWVIYSRTPVAKEERAGLPQDRLRVEERLTSEELAATLDDLVYRAKRSDARK